MTMEVTALRLLEHAHGHVGWLTAAALVHPAILLRRPGRRAHLAVASATLLVTLAFTLGVAVYIPYRELLRREVFVASRSVGLLMERKEHLAFGVLCLAWIGAISHFLAPRTAGAAGAPGDPGVDLRAVARRAFAAAAALSVLVAILGTWVAIFRTF